MCLGIRLQIKRRSEKFHISLSSTLKIHKSYVRNAKVGFENTAFYHRSSNVAPAGRHHHQQLPISLGAASLCCAPAAEIHSGVGVVCPTCTPAYTHPTTSPDSNVHWSHLKTMDLGFLLSSLA